MSKHDAQGREIPDPTPMAIPVGARRPESLTEQIKRLVGGALSSRMAEQGAETLDEANDFDIPDEDDDFTRTDTAYQLMGQDLPFGESNDGEADDDSGRDEVAGGSPRDGGSRGTPGDDLEDDPEDVPERPGRRSEGRRRPAAEPDVDSRERFGEEDRSDQEGGSGRTSVPRRHVERKESASKRRSR